MNFVKYLLSASMIVNLYYLYTYISLFENFPFQNVIPETENDYPMLTKQNLRGMRQEVKTTTKANIIDTLIMEHWNSIYNGVILASGQDSVSSYTASLNCYKHIHSCGESSYIYSNDKQMCHFFGYQLDITDREIILHTQMQTAAFGHRNEIKEKIYKAGMASKGICTGEIDSKTIFIYVPNRDLQFEEPTLTNINLAKRRIIQFNLNVTEIEDILESEIERKIIETFPDLNITKIYSECCQKFILSW